ncbi:protein toll-like [Culex pipiens pallens]|uniref:protein toll-like n=1 Tax=Culex pipiens pallens TaxID=42434 RepID=UPI0019549182|nr:protein toll-like [Culex pipiens pallens]
MKLFWSIVLFWVGIFVSGERLNENATNYWSELCPKECRSCRIDQTRRNLTIDCSNSLLEEVPLISREISLNSSSVTLDVRNNSIRVIPAVEDNPGFGLINKLLLDGNEIDALNVASLHANLSFVSMTYNKLHQLEDTFVDHALKIKTLREIVLINNSWPCECHLAKQMVRLGTKFKQFRVPTCTSGQRLIDLNRSCITKVMFLMVLGSVLFTLTITFSALYIRHRHSIKVRLFSLQICLGFVSHEEPDAALLPFDAFISYSHRNDQFIVNELIPTLEKAPHSYKLCSILTQNFIPGDPIPTEQFEQAIRSSRRTIIYITKQYLQSQWTLTSFRTTFESALTRSRLIVILAEDVEKFDELRTSLRSKTLLERDDPFLWQKLLYAMPHRSAALMRKHRREQSERTRKQTELLREKNRAREAKRLADVVL